MLFSSALWKESRALLSEKSWHEQEATLTQTPKINVESSRGDGVGKKAVCRHMSALYPASNVIQVVPSKMWLGCAFWGIHDKSVWQVSTKNKIIFHPLWLTDPTTAPLVLENLRWLGLTRICVF